jgi:hypothetical protein
MRAPLSMRRRQQHMRIYSSITLMHAAIHLPVSLSLRLQ